MKLSRVFAVLQIIIIIYMIFKELTTPYIFKHSIDIISPSILFFIFLVLGLYFKNKERLKKNN
jgi:hypothetical protein